MKMPENVVSAMKKAATATRDNQDLVSVGLLAVIAASTWRMARSVVKALPGSKK